MKLSKNLMSKGQIKKIVNEDKFTTLQKELDAVGGSKILIFEAKTVEELFSSFALILGVTFIIILIGIFNNSSIKAFLLLLISVITLSYVQYRKPIDKYKESFMKDTELPNILDTVISGLDAGVDLMYTLNYIKKNKKGNAARLISDCVVRVDAGYDLNEALEYVSNMSFNHYFKRMALIIRKSENSTLGLADQLRELQKDIDDERILKKMEHANKLDNALFLPILIGYFIPLVILIVMPLLAPLKNFGV